MNDRERAAKEAIERLQRIFGAGGFAGNTPYWEEFPGVQGEQGPQGSPFGPAYHSSAPGAEPNESPQPGPGPQGTQTLQQKNPKTGQWETVYCDFGRK